MEDLYNPILNKKYDLIVFGHQVWYLSPSIPINSFLQNNISKKLFENTPVVTVIGCRNMWIMAQEKIKLGFTGIDYHWLYSLAELPLSECFLIQIIG